MAEESNISNTFPDIRKKWVATHDYALIESENFKPVLKKINIKSFSRKGSSTIALELKTAILVALIHHGIRVKEFAEAASKIFPLGEKKEVGLYIETLMRILEQRDYRRVTARVLLALQYANPKKLVLAANIYEEYKIKLINLSLGKWKEVVLEYVDHLRNEVEDGKGAKLVEQVLNEEF